MEEILHNFGVDWKLLLAQVFNFFVLFFILRKFVYKPILTILRKRQHEIEKGIEFTKTAEDNLKNAGTIKEQTIKEAKEKALFIVTEAETAANVRKDEILSEAQVKRDSVIAEARVIIDEHKNKMLEGVYSNAEGFLRVALEKVLGRMPASERDAELIKEAVKEARHAKSRV